MFGKEVIYGDYRIVIDTYSTGYCVSYSVYYKDILIRSGGAYTETEALSDANEWIAIDMKERV